ncbi:hypothetical protein HQ489_01880 [Candidatus Woesearchaeota archaeon]|nr:hypothetical protein [Candidatus Woesearchaeota archaeon]
MINKQLILISGVTGSLGEAYLEHYRNSEKRVAGISRSQPKIPYTDVQYLKANLLDPNQSKRCMDKLSLEGITELVLIHPVGRFKFEKNFTEVNPEIYASNVETLTNLVNPLLKRQEKPSITLVAFGSISDKYEVPFWRSYSKSKNALRKYIHELADKEEKIKGVFINLSSVRTRNESILRPYANTRYWITPEEIVQRSVPELSPTEKWKEIDIFNLSPDYSPTIYTNHSAVLKRWTEEMHGENQNNHKKLYKQ